VWQNQNCLKQIGGLLYAGILLDYQVFDPEVIFSLEISAMHQIAHCIGWCTDERRKGYIM
jgi:hypothetical protein